MMKKRKTQIANPMDALASLQYEVGSRGMPTHPTSCSPDIRVVLDQPNGITRYTYAVIEMGLVKAVAIFVMDDPIDGIAAFNVGYAVAKPYRRQGLGKRILEAGIQELSRGLGQHGVKQFYVEAVVGRDNMASQQLAKSVFSNTTTEGTDSESGVPVYSYLKLVSYQL